jgi:hypothetical protein
MMSKGKKYENMAVKQKYIPKSSILLTILILPLAQNMAFKINNSNQGFQYTFFEYKAICISRVFFSMNRNKTPFLHFPIDSWNGILKKDVLRNNIKTFEHDIQLVKI